MPTARPPTSQTDRARTSVCGSPRGYEQYRALQAQADPGGLRTEPCHDDGHHRPEDGRPGRGQKQGASGQDEHEAEVGIVEEVSVTQFARLPGDGEAIATHTEHHAQRARRLEVEMAAVERRCG